MRRKQKTKEIIAPSLITKKGRRTDHAEEAEVFCTIFALVSRHGLILTKGQAHRPHMRRADKSILDKTDVFKAPRSEEIHARVFREVPLAIIFRVSLGGLGELLND